MVGTHALQDKIFGQLADAFTPEFNEALESLQSIIERISNIELPQQTQSTLAAMFYNNKSALLIASPIPTLPLSLVLCKAVFWQIGVDSTASCFCLPSRAP